MFPNKILATSLLQDDFYDGSIADRTPVNWEIFTGVQGYWNVINGELEGSVFKPCDNNDIFSYVVGGDVSWENYSFSTKIKGIIGVDKKVMVRYQSVNTRYDINLVNGQGAALQKWINGQSTLLSWGSFSGSNNIWYSLRVDVFQKNVKVYINDLKVIDFIDDNNPILNGKIGLQVWPGYHYGCGNITTNTTTTRFDDILVTSIDPTGTPSPLPPIVILPGLGSSWNHRALFLNQTVSQSDWYQTPGFTIYDPLIQTLKNAGYLDSGPNKNLFVFYDNWTKPIFQIADDLKIYITNTVHPPSDTKVNLIGHSLGGVIGRTYMQNNPDHKISKLITLGSPQKGSPTVYYAWEGGELEKALEPLSRIGAGLLLHIRGPGFPTQAEALHSVIPGLKDLLPSFNYLKQNNIEIPLSSMNQKNDWLISLNSSIPSPLISSTYPLIGLVPNSTIEWINVGDRNWLDKILNLWPDGKPYSDIAGEGDKIVLTKSTALDSGTIYQLADLDHGTIVTDPASLGKILEILQLPPQQYSNHNNLTINSYLVFYLASPAVISGIFDNNHQPIGSFEGRMGIVPDPLPGKYQVQITGTGSGSYKLIVGQINQNGKDYWTDISGSIALNQIKSYFLSYSSNSPLTLFYPNDYLGSIKTRLSVLNLDNTYKTAFLLSLNKGKYEDAITLLYSFRILTKDFSVKNQIQEIIDECELLYLSNNPANPPYSSTRLVQERKSSQLIFQQMENSLKLKGLKGKTIPQYGQIYLLAQEKLNIANTSNSYKAHINYFGVKMLSSELLNLLH